MLQKARSIFGKLKIFRIVATLIFLTFMSLMVLVCIMAYSRRSGHTGLDMGKIQKMRYDISKEKHTALEAGIKD